MWLLLDRVAFKKGAFGKLKTTIEMINGKNNLLKV